MKKLIFYILIITGGVFTISFTALFIVNDGLKKQQNNSFYTLNHILYNNENHDMLMIGHSRSKNNINPAIVDSICGVNSFNTGNYDYKIIEYKLMLDLYLASKHPKPKYILMILDHEVVNTEMPFYFPEQYYPYIQNDIIYNSMSKYSNDYFLVRYLPFIGITRYNDYMKYLALKAYINPASTDKNAYKGFLPKPGFGEKQPENTKYEILKPTAKGITLLDDFFKLAKNNNIELIVLFPPFLSDSTQSKTPILNQHFFSLVNPVIAKYNNIKTIDMFHSTFQYEKEYFFDTGHLNTEGADEFSRIISDSIKVIIHPAN